MFMKDNPEITLNIDEKKTFTYLIAGNILT